MFRPILMMSMISLASGCSFEPEDPGLCKLNCSSAIIGSNDVPLSFSLKSTTNAVTCAAGAAGQVGLHALQAALHPAGDDRA